MNAKTAFTAATLAGLLAAALAVATAAGKAGPGRGPARRRQELRRLARWQERLRRRRRHHLRGHVRGRLRSACLEIRRQGHLRQHDDAQGPRLADPDVIRVPFGRPARLRRSGAAVFTSDRLADR